MPAHDMIPKRLITVVKSYLHIGPRKKDQVESSLYPGLLNVAAKQGVSILYHLPKPPQLEPPDE